MSWCRIGTAYKSVRLDQGMFKPVCLGPFLPPILKRNNQIVFFIFSLQLPSMILTKTSKFFEPINCQN